MRVVALISGGKDSTYAMMKCLEHGHTLVAVANLHPPAAETEEMDSFMYQTVGHAQIGAIAQALELPLFRREIRGAAIAQGLTYSRTEGDEVEDLLELLLDVKARHPEVEAVCSGAVLSNYQRLRVEQVCGRLGLTSLAYLWQRSQHELLHEMIDAGVHAVVVKTASMGLKPAHLGKTIAELAPLFERLNAQFGFHECGEGGEYETFTLDCPLFKRRLVLSDAEPVRHAADVSLLRIRAVEFCDKEAAPPRSPPPDPPVVQMATPPTAAAPTAEAPPPWVGCCAGVEPPCGEETTRCLELGNGLVLAAAYGRGGGEGEAADAAAAQLDDALGRLLAALHARGVEAGAVLFVRLYLAEMAHYAAVNVRFARFFAEVAPAARAAVQLPLAEAGGALVGVECLGCRGPKRLLHVQSISEWAPRMIGPYCQLTVGGGTAYLAGSLPLEPARMRITAGGARAQTRLALDNCAAVLAGLALSAAETVRALLYVARREDLCEVHAEAEVWLRAATAGRAVQLLLVQVGGLPMGALVEAQLEAATSSSACTRIEWSSATREGCLLECDALLRGRPIPQDADAAGKLEAGYSSLQCCVALDGSQRPSLAALAAAVALAIGEFEERTDGPPDRSGHPIYVRAFFDVRTGAQPMALVAAIEAALGTRRCVAFAVPVESIGVHNAPLAIQVILSSLDARR
ncbi:hypothetical protein AB1Y20_022077 [Prymnesium parvum]|uniref:Diphthine--ammonia ligase n=1 Tax=Prymnesium parvum TaxID=97485 RepID=A0AB34JHR8_PRYPA